MFDLLHAHIEKRIHLAKKECALLNQYFSTKTIRKHQFLLQEGEVCRQLAFVNDGCLRQYSIDHKGQEHVIQFAIRDWWISDLTSFLSGAPSTQNIDALKDSEVLVLEKEARERMLEVVPAMERFFRLLMESNYVASRRRITSTLAASAEERYLGFMKLYPALVEQIPQHHIASYLGITPQSLSRIRKEISARQQ